MRRKQQSAVDQLFYKYFEGIPIPIMELGPIDAAIKQIIAECPCEGVHDAMIALAAKWKSKANPVAVK